jgi:hypothetical protein
VTITFLGVGDGAMRARLESPRLRYATPNPAIPATRASRRRQLPTNHGHAALPPRAIREYQLDSSSKPPHRQPRAGAPRNSVAPIRGPSSATCKKPLDGRSFHISRRPPGAPAPPSTQNFGYRSDSRRSEVTVTNSSGEGAVTRASLWEYAAVQRERYQHATRAEKHRLLDETVAVTGMHRKAAIRLLRRAPRLPPPRRAPAGRDAMVLPWPPQRRCCGKPVAASARIARTRTSQLSTSSQSAATTARPRGGSRSPLDARCPRPPPLERPFRGSHPPRQVVSSRHGGLCLGNPDF